MKLDRIDLADIKSPTRLAEAIVKQIPDLSYPVPVHDIALALDITDIKELSSDGFAGALITDDAKGEGIILVKQGMPERQRFTVGHELGHFLCPHHKPPTGGFQCTSGDMARSVSVVKGREEWEVEANQFSAELLMPKPLYKAALRSRRVQDLGHILDIAGKFEVSKLAGVRRAVDIGDDTCAMVVSKDGVIAHTPHRGKEFPYIALSKGMQLPAKSVSKRYMGEEGQVSSLDECDPSIWTNAINRGMALYEQVAVQANGYKLTLLVIEQSEEDDEDNERDERSRIRW